ncbi:hypothetical protein Tco_0575349 [Tanacetum coccineum]
MDDPNITMAESFEEKLLAIVYNDALTSEPEVSYDFENEFPAIVYNDALTSKPEVSSEPTVPIRRILGNGYGILTFGSTTINRGLIQAIRHHFLLIQLKRLQRLPTFKEHQLESKGDHI